MAANAIFVKMKISPLYKLVLFLALAMPFSGISQGRIVDSLLRVVRKQADDTTKVNTLNKLSGALTDVSNYPKADSVVLVTLQLAEKINYKPGLCLAYANSGWVCYKKGDYSKAIACYLEELKIADESNDKKYIAGACHGLGTVYTDDGDFPKAISYLMQALKIRQELGDKNGQSATLNNIGEIYRGQHEYSKALTFYFKALEANKDISNQYNSAINLENVGLCYQGLGNYDLALKYEFQSKDIYEKLNAQEDIAGVCNSIGLAYLALGKNKEALEYENKSLAIAKSIGAMDDAKEAYKALSDVYQKTGDIKNELKYYRTYINLRDSIFSQTNTKQITSAEMNFEFDKQKELEKAAQDKRDALQKEDARKQRIVFKFVFGIMLLFIAFAAIVVRSLRTSRRKTEIIHKQKEETENSYKKISELGEIGRKITATLSFEKIAETVYENVNQLMDATIFCLGIPNLERNTLDFPEFMEKGKKFDSSYDLNDSTRFPVICFKNNQEILINDLEKEYKQYIPFIPPAVSGETPLSFIYLPLLKNDKVIGVINVGSFKKNTYSNHDLEMLRTIASYTAIALENFSTYNKLNVTLKEIEKLSFAVSQSTNTVMVFNSDLELEWVNDTFAPTTGMTMEEFKRRKGKTLLEMSSHPEVEQMVSECIIKKTGVSYESVNHTKNMGARWFQSMISPIFDERGNIKNIMVIDSDITELKDIEEDLRQRNKDILDSINYAKRLQDAIIPPLSVIKKYLPESFVLYKPKDIVAGDFYWMEHKGDSVLIAACDCTGHGVTGAMVSVVCSNALNRALNEFQIRDAGKLLDKTRELVLETFEKSESEVQDGMDISFCAINLKEGIIEWSGANNPLWYIRNNELHEIKGDKQPIGKQVGQKLFTTHKLKIQKGDIFYLFTDGYADQFGGPIGKKYKYKQLQQTLLNISSLSMDEQKEILDQTIENWKGELEQVDDILIVGIRV